MVSPMGPMMDPLKVRPLVDKKERSKGSPTDSRMVMTKDLKMLPQMAMQMAPTSASRKVVPNARVKAWLMVDSIPLRKE